MVQYIHIFWQHPHNKHFLIAPTLNGYAQISLALRNQQAMMVVMMKLITITVIIIIIVVVVIFIIVIINIYLPVSPTFQNTYLNYPHRAV